MGVKLWLGSGLWVRCRDVVAEHGPDDVDAASGEGDEGLFVGGAFCAFAVVEHSG